MDRVIYDFDALKARGVAPLAPARARRLRDQRVPDPRIGVIYNARSHRNQGQDLAAFHRPGVSVARPDAREDIADALVEFAAKGIDYLVINGGDGTVRDVLTIGNGIFGDDWPALAIVPKGKTNALNVDLDAPADWSLADAIAAYAGGRRTTRRPLSVSRLDSGHPPMLGFVFGAGAFTLGTAAGQDAHKLGFFNSLAVILTGVWGVIQALFGSDRNLWRRGTAMTLAFEPSGDPVPHAGHGDPARRTIILSSTLQRLPMGIKLFGHDHRGLKMAVLDKPRRRILACVPAILAGWQPEWLRRAGFHQFDAAGFSISVEEPVILDGEVFPAGRYLVEQGPELTFVTP